MFGGEKHASSGRGSGFAPEEDVGDCDSNGRKNLKQDRFETSRKELGNFLNGLPKGTKVALESVGFSGLG